jgi:iron complex outermembrane receptor protein
MDFARRIGWALALLLCVGTVAAQAQTGTVTGRVTTLAGNSISGAEVRVEDSKIHTLTDEQGRYELKDVPEGQRQIRVLMMGFQSQVLSVTVTAGTPATLDFKLQESVLQLPAVEVVVGSRARHTAADELAVPVDVYNSEVLLRQGSTETSQALQSVSPSVNFPRQSVTDATDVVRPFTLRGLSPDHTLVLVNNMRRHQTALVNTFAYGTAAGSSGVDMNAIPASAIDRVEVLRDGAAAQYGSDAIAGVVNVVTRKGRFRPFASVTGGQYVTNDYDRDGGTLNVAGGWGLPLLSGSLVISAEYLDRQPTNRAWADAFDESGTGVADVVGPDGKVIQKNNPVPQPNQHWGDGLERDLLTFASAHLPLFTQQLALYATGSYSFREGNGNGYRRYETDPRNWPSIYPIGFLPEFRPKVTDYSLTGGVKTDVRGWFLDVGAAYGHNGFRYELENTLNSSLGPSLPTASSATATIPASRTRPRSSRASCSATRPRWTPACGRSCSSARSTWASSPPSRRRSGRRTGASAGRRSRASWPRTSTAGMWTRAAGTRRAARRCSRGSPRATRRSRCATTSARSWTWRPRSFRGCS